MFNVVRENVYGNSIDFIESLYQQFCMKGRLSPKQYEALKKFYLNARKYNDT